MMGGATTGPRLVSISVEVDGAGRTDLTVSYCDVCRRWGERGSEHVCGQNWSEHLLPVLAARGGRAP